jgi:hypothetical protein
MIHVPNNAPETVLSFVRQDDHNKVFAVFNFSKKVKTVKFEEGLFPGTYTDYFGGERIELDPSTELKLAPWAYRVFVK